MPPFIQNPSSYRDPSGFVFEQEGNVFRQVNRFYKDDFEQLINSGLYQHLVNNQLLIPHLEMAENLTGSTDWYRTLQPEKLSFVSYPYEWGFEMWKEAALATLQIAKAAIGFGMMLKDASAYNLQWHKGKMIFIDTLSFERYDETKPWIAYRQFCEHFFAPLALMHYLQEPMQHLFLAFPDGIPLRLAKKMLPYKSKWNLHTQLHVHLHASVSNKPKNIGTGKLFSAKKLADLLRSLEEGIKSFSFNSTSGVWSGYYDEAAQREGYLEEKKQTISNWLKELNFKTVLDAGANEGTFSELAVNKAERILSTDGDHFSVNNLYKKTKQQNWTNIYPLLLDLSNPWPAIGVNNVERSSFLERSQSDLVMALALIHHLAIGKNISFEQLATLFHSLGETLLIEFVPKQDPKIQLMLQNKADIYHDYSEGSFLEAFQKKFSLVKQKAIANSGRTLFLFCKK